MKSKNNIIKSASLYTFGSFFVRGLSLITVPIFTRLLDESEYGFVSIYTTWTALIGIFIGLGIEGTIGSAKGSLDDEEYKKYLSSTLFLATLSFFIIFILGILNKGFLAKMMGIDTRLVPIMIVQSFSGFVISFYYSNLTFKDEAAKYLKVSLVSAILNIILSVLFIILLQNERYLGKIYAAFIVNFIFGTIIYYRIMKCGSFSVNKKYWIFCLPIAIPIIFHSLSHLVLNQADRIMLQEFTDKAIVGLYSFTYTIGALLHMVSSSINNAWVAWYFNALKEDLKNQIKEKSKIYIFTFTIFTSLFLLGGPEVVKILAPKNYWVGIPLLPLIILGYYFVFLYTFGVNYEFYKKKTIFIALGTIISGFINIVLNLILIPKVGMYGAAIATVISYIFLFLMHEFIVRILFKHFDFPFKYYVISIIYMLIMLIFTYILLEFIIVRWFMIFMIFSLTVLYLDKKFELIIKIRTKIKNI